MRRERPFAEARSKAQRAKTWRLRHVWGERTSVHPPDPVNAPGFTCGAWNAAGGRVAVARPGARTASMIPDLPNRCSIATCLGARTHHDQFQDVLRADGAEPC